MATADPTNVSDNISRTSRSSSRSRYSGQRATSVGRTENILSFSRAVKPSPTYQKTLHTNSEQGSISPQPTNRRRSSSTSWHYLSQSERIQFLRIKHSIADNTWSRGGPAHNAIEPVIEINDVCTRLPRPILSHPKVTTICENRFAPLSPSTVECKSGTAKSQAQCRKFTLLSASKVGLGLKLAG